MREVAAAEQGGGRVPPGWAGATELKMTLMELLSWMSDIQTKLVNSFPDSTSMN